MSHLETLLREYLEWQGFLCKHNVKVGKRAAGGWEMELDIIGYHPHTKKLVHYEPSLDAHSWKTREERYTKKFEAARKYIQPEVFAWLPKDSPIEHFAIFPSKSIHHKTLAGGTVLTIDELMAEIITKVQQTGSLSKNAISEVYPLLRTLQLSICGYIKPPK